MADRYNIDSHKLIYHPHRISKWMQCHENWKEAKSIYPIYLEISPYGACNHRCIFCALDYVGYQNRSLDENILRKRLTEMASLGIKSVMFAGEGEPMLWRPLPDILDHCSSSGIDTSLTTNMVLFSEKNVDAILRNCIWIKTSINAGTAETYSKIHRTKASDFDRVLNNFKMCVARRKEKGYTCTIGGQMLLLPENADEAFTLGRGLKEIGIDYLVIKPYSQHLRSITKKYGGIDYRKFLNLEEKLQSLNRDGFNVIFRARTMSKLFENERGYNVCYSTPFFWAYIASDGCIYGCSAYLGDERFCYGNINESRFKEIWEGDRRKESYHFIKHALNIDECRKNCRMDEINRYLWKLKHPDKHVNFI